MQHPTRERIPRQNYPFPWSMPELEDAVGSPPRTEAGTQSAELIDSLQQWLREFGDEQAGGFTPPPMH